MKKYSLGTLWTILIILLFFLIITYDKASFPKREYKNNMKLLYSEINGRVINIFNNHGLAFITLDNRDDKFWIYYVILENGEKEFFLDYVELNDSLYSPINSDSIYVIRKNKKHGYRVDIDYAHETD